MPFTPFHFGPALLLKSAAPRRVSVASYAAANIVIDVETLYHLLRHDTTVHQWAHTFVGAGSVGIALGGLLAVIARTLVPRLPIAKTMLESEVGAGPIVLGAFLGAITHPFLDGLMHSDIHPFRPFTDANPLLGLLTIPTLEAVCVVAGILGAAILFARRSTLGAIACLLLMAMTTARVEIAINVPMRMGDMARQLPDRDITDLVQAAKAAGLEPWVIRGHHGMYADVQAVDAFGAATVTTQEVRRGPVATLVRQRAAGVWQPWTVGSRAEYIQVAVPRKNYERIENDADINRPFRISGRYTDADIVSLVTLIRSSPGAVRGDWVILSIVQQRDGTSEVMLRTDDVSGQRVTVVRQGGTWIVTSASFWIS